MTLTIRPFLHPKPPTSVSSFGEVTSNVRRLFDTIFQLRRGKTENTVLLTLTANAASTTLTDARISIQSALHFDPLTANAAAELGAGTLYALEANRSTGSVAITHANNAQNDRKYIVTITG